MNDWQSTYLGRGALPRDLSGFELEAFFTYSESERRVIDDEWRTPSLKLALALQIGFLRMTGRLLEALRLVPPALAAAYGAGGSTPGASWPGARELAELVAFDTAVALEEKRTGNCDPLRTVTMDRVDAVS